MSLEAGSKLGPYEIQRLLGVGGMGEVYVARDTRLGRDVAVKVLPVGVASEPEALARFDREAKAVAALAHPNIVTIYDLGAEGDRVYAAMELLDGETLRERLEHGPLPSRKTVALARQIARGLGAAHDRGIVHRDLKPENIFLTRDGQAKILDFGLAVERGLFGTGADEAAMATRTSLTMPGAVMGTVGYMAPEQIRGEPVDHRGDIFSFGAVLYEMLSGRRAFERDTPPETMTAILREDPPHLDIGSSAVSPSLDRVVQRCLEKSPDERFHSARDLAFAIDNSLSVSGATAVADVAAVPAAAPTRSGRAGVVVAIAAVVGLGLGWIAATALRSPPAERPPARVRPLTTSGRDAQPTASPGGNLIAFRSTRDGTPRIWIRQIAGGGEQPVTDGPDAGPRFSPDGSTLLFLRDEGPVMSVYRQALVGGQPKKLVHHAYEAAWSPEGRRIAFSRTRSVEGRRVASIGIADAQDGSERIVAEFDSLVGGLHWSPDGSTLIGVAGAMTGNVPDVKLVQIAVEDGSVEHLRPANRGVPMSSPVYTAAGDIVVAVAGSLLGDGSEPLSSVVRFDPRSGETTTLLWASGLFPLQGQRSDFTAIDILRDETLVFHSVDVRQTIRLVDAAEDRGGEIVDTSRAMTRGQSRDRQPVFSPDGERVLFSSNRSGNLDLWQVDVGTGELRQVTDDAAQDWDPAFTPDGRNIVWSSDRSGHLEVWVANADGSGARQLTQDGLDAENPTVTGDGDWVLYWSANPTKQGAWKIRIDGSEPMQLTQGPSLMAEVSPDGRYAALVFLEIDNLRSVVRVVDVATGEMIPFEIEVPTPLQAESIIFGRMRWMPDGGALAYVGVDEKYRTGIYVQDFVPGEDTSATRRPLAGFSPDLVAESFGISPDGKTVAISALEQTFEVMLAEGVPDVARPH